MTAIGSSGATFNTLALTSSLDNFVAELDSDSQQFPDEADPDAPDVFDPTTYTLDIPDVAAFESITGPVTFRTFIFRDEPTTGGGGGFVLDDRNGAFVQLNAGAAPIPEPASAGLLLVGAGLLVPRRRRA